jgi:hypothetical protein
VSILRRRDCIESVGEFDFELFFALSLVCHFSCNLLVLWPFHLLDDFFKLFFDFRSSSCASYSIGIEIQTLSFLLSMYTSRGGEIEKTKWLVH